MWLTTKKDRLFVRDCYPELFELCQKIFSGEIQRSENGEIEGIFIKGTPGVGKSCFLDYALHRYYRKEGKSVLYLRGPGKRAYAFLKDDTVLEMSLAIALEMRVAADVDVVLYDPPEASYLTDDVDSLDLCSKPFIVAVSPDPENCKKLQKDTLIEELFMGTCSLDEAMKMRELCFSDKVSAKSLKERFLAFGGIVRWLFKSTVEDVNKDQVVALRLIQVQPTIADSGEVAKEFKGLWSIYHLQPVKTLVDEQAGMTPGDGQAGMTLEDGKHWTTPESRINYFDYTIEVACDSVGARIRRALLRRTVLNLWEDFIDTPASQGSMRGIRYEMYVHKKILTFGLNQTAIKLNKSGWGEEEENILVDKNVRRITLKSNNLGERLAKDVMKARKAKNGGYLYPKTPNFPVVDSIYVPPQEGDAIFFQMTTVIPKDIKAEELAKELFQAVQGKLVIVVPNSEFVTKKIKGGPDGLDQYVLELAESDEALESDES
jgi:hypothetical protein